MTEQDGGVLGIPKDDVNFARGRALRPLGGGTFHQRLPPVGERTCFLVTFIHDSRLNEPWCRT